ncbi:ABC transporter ATP-binding protein [Pseudostreptobacillus hongkongensis]|uniref:ABC transporter ATP-binding protein n=1 Tax=Pseudostreptobacillus hongkongensis TaxID=1162717 RepID=UPI000837227F|nr:ABC transporter ATP-binding protein [Pseudostreptobacillus hongkongensis]
MLKLEIENLCIEFENKVIVKDINLKVNKGELVSIVGVSGTGKSTIFNAVAGLISPKYGNIYLNKENIVNKKGKVSYMLQKDLLLPFRTTIDNIALPLLIKGVNKEEAYKKINNYIDKFGLKNQEFKYPNKLSGGQRQRAALLRTYMFSSDMILLDEPFSALDFITKKNIHKWYMDIRKELNLTTLLITHDIDEAIYLSDKISILASNGEYSTLSKEIEINLENRDNTSPEFNNIKRKILNLMHIE